MKWHHWFIPLIYIGLTACEEVADTSCTSYCSSSTTTATLVLDNNATQFDSGPDVAVSELYLADDGKSQNTTFRLYVKSYDESAAIQSFNFNSYSAGHMQEGDVVNFGNSSSVNGYPLSYVRYHVDLADGSTIFESSYSGDGGSVLQSASFQIDELLLSDNDYDQMSGSASIVYFDSNGAQHSLAASFSGNVSYSLDEPPVYSDGGSGGSGGSGSSYNYTVSCPDGFTSSTIPIPAGSCQSEYEYYADIFICNDVGAFNTAACQLESCTGKPFACGSY